MTTETSPSSGENEIQTDFAGDRQTTLPNCVLEQFMLCAFRYAMTRREGVLSEMLERILPYWDALNPEFQAQIKHDIRFYLDGGRIHEEDKHMCMETLKR